MEPFGAGEKDFSIAIITVNRKLEFHYISVFTTKQQTHRCCDVKKG